ncbi:MAG: four helix bundle protein [Tannerella sp.]|uniref:four helix bundle protein n=1 Tax=Tannerella sp. TaxID=2382127 RepID=UPI003FA311A9
MEHLYAFEKLDAWQVSRVFVKEVYHFLQKNADFEPYNIASHIRRAAVSVPLNIAEGTARQLLEEQSYFSKIAYGHCSKCVVC